MLKDFGRFLSRIKGRKVSFFGRTWLNFGFKKVTCCLNNSGTDRHSTVKWKNSTKSELKLVPVIVP